MKQKPTIEDVVTRLTEGSAKPILHTAKPLPRPQAQPPAGQRPRWLFVAGGAIGAASLAALTMLR